MVQARFINDTTSVEITSESELRRVRVNQFLEHGNLQGRDLPDQHPISAITGLQEALNTIPDDYVSEAEFEAALLEKQDVISDLSEIRQGATLGATAVQPSELESYATKGYVDDGLSEKQDALTAGSNVQIVGNTISATDTTYTAGTGISIVGNVISNTQTSAEWGNVQGDISAQTDLQNALDEKADISNIPTKTSDLTNDSGYITNSALVGYATQNWVENQGYITGITGSDVTTALGYTPYNSTNPNGYQANIIETVKVNNTALTPINKEINITVPTQASDVNALPDTTKYGASLSLTINSSTYVITAQLKDQNGNNLGTAQTIDLPLESVVVNGSYDSTNKKIVLTLQNGTTIDIPVGDLVAGLQTEITSSNKLDADLVDDSTSTNKFVTSSEKTTWNGKQDAISDLSTIRSNATAGKFASDTIATYGNIVTHNTSEFATSAQGALADTALQPNDNISELQNDVGYITGITSTDVTTALGYTPYDASNPNGYTSNVGTVTSVNSISPDANGNVSLTIPTVEAYTAAEVQTIWESI